MGLHPQHVAAAASLLSESSRSIMLTYMLDGRFHTSGELARAAGITPQTASFHLKKLEEAGFLDQTKQGRHRYYGLKDPAIAQVIESLLTITPPAQVSSFKQAAEDQAIRYARTCYDHLAGSLGIQVAKALVDSGYIIQDHDQFILTAKGEAFFSNFGINLETTRRKRRSFSHCCLDWSERKHHLAGALGSEMLERFLEMEWLRRKPESRALLLTEKGRNGFAEVFGLDTANIHKTHDNKVYLR
ncbi:ArsR/SmtB family transcription factor [Terribacillus saccharophilus]|uniref:Transcriptional regulator n=1 Tax=Terribacillus saccharophilus TaxID=361277 RepID=A0ABX4GVR9_9BACI|nr:winged helix-turn-helix domain-containing protein [Terribacillus saccharophilus]PAD34643.1 transcriptional regulator [Terribacillus saccharophilus]PAD95391.1 transcriptional regulator [Terribacillus saccharophilus]PAD98969.1 transcriptional regulator [Terribacillus saccharophilus]